MLAEECIDGLGQAHLPNMILYQLDGMADTEFSLVNTTMEYTILL